SDFGFGGAALSVDSAVDTTIQGNYVNLNVAGTELLGTGGALILADDVVFGGTTAGASNVFAGDVHVNRGTKLVFQGNIVGRDATGAHALPGLLDIQGIN